MISRDMYMVFFAIHEGTYIEKRECHIYDRGCSEAARNVRGECRRQREGGGGGIIFFFFFLFRNNFFSPLVSTTQFLPSLRFVVVVEIDRTRAQMIRDSLAIRRLLLRHLGEVHSVHGWIIHDHPVNFVRL